MRERPGLTGPGHTVEAGMELIAKVDYRCPSFELTIGQSTADLKVKLSDEKKRQLLSTFPGWFDVVQEAGKIETPEERLTFDTGEKRTGKLRKG